MLVLVIGGARTGKTTFINNNISKYTGDAYRLITNPTREMLNDINNPDGSTFNIVEVQSYKMIPSALTADLVVFTSSDAMDGYFNRVDMQSKYSFQKKHFYQAIKSTCGVDYTPVIFDSKNKRFIVHYN